MMTHEDINAVMRHYRPGVPYGLSGTDIKNMTIADEHRMTREEIEALIPEAIRLDAFFDIRAERDRLLAASDWTQIPDAPVDAASWAKYRQALRDLPAKIKDPTADVAWPEPPK